MVQGEIYEEEVKGSIETMAEAPKSSLGGGTCLPCTNRVFYSPMHELTSSHTGNANEQSTKNEKSKFSSGASQVEHWELK